MREYERVVGNKYFLAQLKSASRFPSIKSDGLIKFLAVCIRDSCIVLDVSRQANPYMIITVGHQITFVKHPPGSSEGR